MNKKIITVVIVVAVLLIAGAFYFLFFNQGRSVGIDNNIQNESNKKG